MESSLEREKNDQAVVMFNPFEYTGKKQNLGESQIRE